MMFNELRFRKLLHTAIDTIRLTICKQSPHGLLWGDAKVLDGNVINVN